ncbi:MAG: DUF86 domain-containing protein [Bacteroidales bacterium]|nr:DUF86 domain-containing protein [Bacteroidales bacterium]
MREVIRDRERLEHIITAIDYALEFSEGVSRETLGEDKMRYYAIVKNIENIGEASYMLSGDFKSRHAEIEWAAVEGMRHFLVHEYYQVSDGKLWNVLKYDLLPLRHQIESYLSETCV